MPRVQNKARKPKAAREKCQVTYKGKPIRTTAGFSMETLKARITCIYLFQALKQNNCQPRQYIQESYSLKMKEK
jgi:hypothetical protein